jgi:hypothetical protein
MFIHRETRGLYHENVRAAHVFHNLDINLAVRKPGNRSFAAFHAQEGANLVGQGLVRGAAEDLELIVCARTLRFLLLRLHLLLLLRLFRCCRYCRHGFFHSV